jgi:hypothetical protein
MRFSIPVLVLCVVAVTVVGAGEAPEQPTLVRVTVTDARQAREVGGLLNLDEATRGFDLVGWALPEDLSKLGALGYSWTHVDEPRSPEALTMCVDPDGGTYDPPYAWDCYPTWEQYEDMLEHYATNFPEICRLVNIGPSGEGSRALYALKISDNPDAEEAEPEFLYTGTMHGDELAGYPLLLRLADEILGNYDDANPDPVLKSMVDDMVLWINPLANPDGTFAGGNHTVSGSQRYYTTTSTDPNRSFPIPPEAPTPAGRAPETQAMMALADAENFTMAANFHGGAEVVNYPWDMYSQRHVDDAWFQTVSRVYADAVHAENPDYMDGFDDGITNGYDWYWTEGSRQDYMNYYFGCREVTIELSNVKSIDAAQLEDHWTWNRQALIDFVLQANAGGIHGIITDASSDDPVAATVTIVGHDDSTRLSRMFSDPDAGDYQRPIEDGTWTVEYSAWGYQPTVVSGILVASSRGPVTTVDVALSRDTGTGRLEGTVSDSTSLASIRGAKITLSDADAPIRKSGATGDYGFAAVPAGTYNVTASAWGFQPITVASIPVISSSTTTQDFALSPVSGAGSIVGVVRDSVNSAPIAAARIDVLGHAGVFVESGGGGAYSLSPVPSGTWRLGVSAPGYLAQVVEAVVGGGAVTADVLMDPLSAVTMSGRVSNSETLVAVADAEVSLRWVGTESVTTDASGNYALTGLTDRAYEITVEADGFRTHSEKLVLGGPSYPRDFLLDPLHTLAASDFESGDDGFVSSGQAAGQPGWQRGMDTDIGAASGVMVWGTTINGDYSDSANWMLTSPAVQLGSDRTSAQVTFSHRFKTEEGYDGGQVLVSVDGGGFELIVPERQYTHTDVSALGGTPGFSRSNGRWRRILFDLSSYLGHSVQIQWRFGSDSSQTDEGWFIDDVVISEAGSTGLPAPIFSDGFESGGMGAWSATN